MRIAQLDARAAAEDITRSGALRAILDQVLATAEGNLFATIGPLAALRKELADAGTEEGAA